MIMLLKGEMVLKEKRKFVFNPPNTSVALICTTNQLIGFYMRGTLAFNGLRTCQTSMTELFWGSISIIEVWQGPNTPLKSMLFGNYLKTKNTWFIHLIHNSKWKISHFKTYIHYTLTLPAPIAGEERKLT